MIEDMALLMAGIVFGSFLMGWGMRGIREED